jgi:hypothetical protein
LTTKPFPDTFCSYEKRVYFSYTRKAFMWKFNDEGNMKNHAVHQQTYLTNLILRKGVLTSDDTIYKSFSVFVSGAARSFIQIKGTDSTAIDSMDVDNKLDF